MERQPGQWTGSKWVCNDQPQSTKDIYYYCCPDGFRRIGRKAVQARGTRYGYNSFKTSRMVCETEEGIMACGPKPATASELKCCPEVHKWFHFNSPCPMPQARRGVDLDFMSRLQLQTPGRPGEANLGRKLTMIGIPFLLAISILMYFIFVN